MTRIAKWVRVALVVILLGYVQVLLDSVLTAEESSLPQSIQYRRVFVPSEDLPLLSSDFVPVKIQEFEQLMTSYREQVDPYPDITTPILTQSLFVASLVGEDLVSEASRCTISCQSETPRVYTFTPCSLAIRPTTANSTSLAASAREAISPDGQPFRYDQQGAPTMVLSQPTDFWFGWSLHGESDQDPSRLKYKLEVPRCLNSRLLLELPPMWRVESASCVARRCEEPEKLLGSQWPGNVDIDKESETENWWTIELSGSTSISFDLLQSVEAFQLNFDFLILRERVDYRLLPSSLEVVSEFQFADSVDSLSEMSIRVDPGTHISSITLDEVPLEWRPSKLPSCVDILHTKAFEDREPSSRKRLMVRGLTSWPLAIAQNTLPRIQIAKGFSIDGVGSLAIHQDWVVNQVKLEKGHIFSRSGTTQLGGLGRCDFEWTGEPPEIVLHATPRSHLGRVDSLTRLANDTDGLVATTWVSIGANSTPRTALRFALSPGWAIESVQSSDRRYTTTVHRIPSSDNSEWQIQLVPAVENQAITLEIRARNASFTGSDGANSPTLTFDGDRPVFFPELKQTDIYWIEPTGRYRIDATPGLLQCQIRPEQITESQRQRLPRIGEVWLIKPDGGKIPRLTFRRQAAPYTAQLETTIEPSILGVSASYRLTCVPLAGAVSSVTIDINHPLDLPIRWRQRIENANGNFHWMPLESQMKRRDDRKTPKNSRSTTAARVIQIKLPNPMSEQFELEGYADFQLANSDGTDSATMQIPLPSLPEAAQKDATLQIDERLNLAQTDKPPAWTPLGYTRFETGNEAHRFRYDPIQLASVEIDIHQENRLANVWLTDVVSQYQLYLDGQAVFNLRASLKADEASAVNIDYPRGWCLRKALLDGKAIDATDMIDKSSHSHRMQIWIPRQDSALSNADLTLIFDGPKSAIRHRQPIDFPAIKPTCPILNQRFELWLPPYISVHSPTSKSKIGFPLIDFSELFPSRWYQLLWPHQNSFVTGRQSVEDESQLGDTPKNSSQTQLAWSTKRSDDVRSKALTLLVNESMRAEDWTIFFGGFAISLCIAHIRKSFLAITGLILAFGIIATNGRVLEAAQLAALGWLIGVALLMINMCSKPKENRADRRFFLSGTHGSHSGASARVISKIERVSPTKTQSRYSTIWIGWAVFHACFIGASSAMAQSQLERVYHVVLPVDSKDELSSDVAYVSEDLLQELYRHKSALERATQFLSARYELRLDDSSLRNSSNNPLLTLRYEIDVRDIRQPISLPLMVDQASFVALLVDGSEIPLGSRLRWDDRVLQWMPPNRGLTQIELTIAAVPKQDPDGRYSIEVDLVPFAGAELDIEASELTDVQCEAVGQISVPSSGHYQVALGPLNKLAVGWRKPERDIRVAMPTATIEDEFVVVKDTVLARTNIQIIDASFQQKRFDLECDSAWQPLGKEWGSATLIDTAPASSNTRRRYHLRWEDPVDEHRPARSIVIYWVANDLRAPLMNLPEIELPGIRIQDHTIRFVGRKDAEWTFEGLQSWSRINSSSRLDWFSRATGVAAAYRNPLNAPSAFLRRVTTTTERQHQRATLESQLKFSSNRAHCKTTITLDQTKIQSHDIRLRFPADIEIETVRVNQIEVPFSTFLGDDALMQLQVFVDPEFDGLESIIIESTQSYVDSSWTPLPVPHLESDPNAEHWVSATRAVSQHIEWDGLDLLSSAPGSTNLSSVPSLPNNIERNLEVEIGTTRINTAETEFRNDQDSLDASGRRRIDSNPRYRILRSIESNPGFVVSRLTRSDERWNFSVHGLVEAGANPIDGVLLEVPISILEGLQCSHRLARYESPEANRQLVYVFSDEPSSNKSFEFELSSSLPPTESNSTTTLPEIRMMGDFEWQQWLIVPRSIASQEARWSLSGARAVDVSSVPDFARKNMEDALQSVLVVIPTTDRPSVRLSNVAANPLPIALTMTTHEVEMDRDQSQRIRSSFFFIPRGQLTIPVIIPRNCELVAVECNGHQISESAIGGTTNDEKPAAEKELILDVRLLSSSMPQMITLYTTKPAALDRVGIGNGDLPRIVEASPLKQLIMVDSPSGATGSGAQEIVVSQTQKIMVESVLETVEQASGFIAESPLSERSQWWRDWEAATATIWRDSTQLREPDFQKALSDRRRLLLERLQLQAQFPKHTATLGESFISSLDGAVVNVSPQSNDDAKQYFLLDSSSSSASDLEIRAVMAKPLSSLDSKVWFGWLVWFLAAIGAIGYTYRHFDRWSEALKQFVLNRPWWLIGALGLLSFAIAPSRWYGPSLLFIALIFAIRTYWHEMWNVSDASR